MTKEKSCQLDNVAEAGRSTFAPSMAPGYAGTTPRKPRQNSPQQPSLQTLRRGQKPGNYGAEPRPAQHPRVGPPRHRQTRRSSRSSQHHASPHCSNRRRVRRQVARRQAQRHGLRPRGAPRSRCAARSDPCLSENACDASSRKDGPGSRVRSRPAHSAAGTTTRAAAGTRSRPQTRHHRAAGNQQL